MSPSRTKEFFSQHDIVRNNSKSLQGNNYFDDEDNEEGVTWDYMILDEVRISLFYLKPI